MHDDHISTLTNHTTAKIEQQAGLFEAADRDRTEAFLVLGDRLRRHKRDLEHGQWLPYLARAGLAERTPQQAMALAGANLSPDQIRHLGGFAKAEALASWSDSRLAAIANRRDEIAGDLEAWLHRPKASPKPTQDEFAWAVGIEWLLSELAAA